jgi:polyisoprenoid-binding protein YceI
MSHRVLVFTFKEGLLARAAHDLRLHVERFTITREGEEVTARLEPASIVVDGVMHGEQLRPNELDERDRSKIVQTIRDDILRTRLHPRIEFRGRFDPASQRCLGELTLCGVRRPLTIAPTREHGRLRANVSLRPSDFGIAPYKALAGAIRLQDRVRVELDLDAEALGLGLGP